MMKNMGTTDRIIRTIAALVILYVTYTALSGIVAFLGYVIVAVLLVTSATAYCPAYKMMGMDTTKKR